MKTWLRRNRWGLIALPLLLALIGLPEVDDLYNRYYLSRYVQAIDVEPGAQGAYGRGRVRLDGIGPFRPKTPEGDQIAVPPGYQFVVAHLYFDLDDPKAFGACDIFLEDQQGRRFEPDPRELSLTSYHSGNCADYKDEKSSFVGQVYFLLPPDAEPAAIRIEVITLKPRFLRLRVA
jgi:hypothetical protein